MWLHPASSEQKHWTERYQSQGVKMLNNLKKKAGSVLEATLDPFEIRMQQRMVHKITTIMDNSEHPL